MPRPRYRLSTRSRVRRGLKSTCATVTCTSLGGAFTHAFVPSRRGRIWPSIDGERAVRSSGEKANRFAGAVDFHARVLFALNRRAVALRGTRIDLAPRVCFRGKTCCSLVANGRHTPVCFCSFACWNFSLARPLALVPTNPLCDSSFVSQ